ncbi:acyltransferase [Nocardia sp. BMG111209]|uniref:acyltransferase family protein n=1 Tax=Nocardia sp. BMG111209 TaxID=1160137 RepID=UPI000372A947|nr:acyltransferase [Nocardia sp. BMG111209]
MTTTVTPQADPVSALSTIPVPVGAATPDTTGFRDPSGESGAPRGFVAALEGMRGLAALGVVITHVAFETGATGTPVLGRIWDRFGMAVAVFFALSGFLLWRPHAAAARGGDTAPGARRYLLHRAARILPAYWVVVCAVLILLPTAVHPGSVKLWLANLALLQVYVPLTLTDGLTQMWSLSVEAAFYLVLPVLALALRRLRGPAARWRAPILLTLALVSLIWNFLPVPTPAGTYADNWLPAYLPWFAAGMLLAELVDIAHRATEPPRWQRLLGNRWPMWAAASTAFLLSATVIAGPPGLQRAAPGQYATKMALGAVVGFGLLAPLVLGTGRHRWLGGRIAAAVGRWSYGIFIWHLAVLTMMFPMFGFLPFSGGFLHVLALTVCFTLPLAAVSYALVEEPARRWVRRRFG